MTKHWTHAHILPVAVVAASLAAFASPLRAQETPGSYALISHDLPKAVAPGQRVVGHLTWKVLTPGDPAFTNPVVDFYSTGGQERGMRLPGVAFNPWSFPAQQAPGDLLRTAFTLDVPLDFPAGPAAFAALIARNVPDKGWQYADMQDADGRPSADAIRWPLQVKAASGGAAPGVPLVVKAMPAPHLDGKLAPGEWDAAGRSGGFLESDAGGVAHAATEAFVGHDEANLYVAFLCAEPNLAGAARTAFGGRDPSVWNNECVEVLLDPQAARVSYMHFLVDIAGQRHDLLGTDSFGFNPKWSATVAEGEGQWSAEISIPFSSLGVAAPQPGDAWCANLCRERKVVDELSAWQPTFGTFSAPGRFGLLVFDDLRAYLQRRAAKVDAGGAAWPAELQEAQGKWQTAVDDWKAKLAAAGEPLPEATYPQLSATLDALATDLAKLKLKAAALSGQGVLVAQAAPYEPFRGEPGPTDQPAADLDLVALQGEWLDLAWNLTNLTDKPITLRCTLRHGDPQAAEAFLTFGLPGVQGQWRLATPVAAGDGRAIYDALVPLPAGTVTLSPGVTSQVWLSLQAETPPAEGPAKGHVRFERIDGGAGEPTTTALALRVLPRDIRTPRAAHAFTWNFLSPAASADPAWLDAHLRDLAAHGVDVTMVSSLRDLPRVKANPDGTLAEVMDFGKLDALLAASKPHMSQFWVNLDIWEKDWVRTDLFGLPIESPAYEKAFKIWFAAVRDHLLAAGLTYDNFMVNPYDESVGEECRKLARWVKETDPKVRVVIDCSTNELETARKMDALTDVWVPHYKVHFAEDEGGFFDLLRQGGKPHWCYFYSEGGTDKGQDATRHYLAKFWWAYGAGVTGIGYWAQQYYGDPWYRAQWSTAYDTSLVYPVEGGVLASRRWEAWRRGWQDYQLLALTKAALARAGDEAAVAKLDTWVKDVVAVPGDPARAAEARAWLREQLAAVKQD